MKNYAQSQPLLTKVKKPFQTMNGSHSTLNTTNSASGDYSVMTIAPSKPQATLRGPSATSTYSRPAKGEDSDVAMPHHSASTNQLSFATPSQTALCRLVQLTDRLSQPCSNSPKEPNSSYSPTQHCSR